MTLLRPAFRLSIGDQRIDTVAEPLASTVVDLTVLLDMSAAADRFEIVLGRVGSFAPARDDEATIELGYADEGEELVQVMHGIVDEVDARAERVRIVGFGAAALLSRNFAEKAFRDMAAAAIVRDLADRAGIGVVRSGSSETLPYYVVDSRRSFLAHMVDLADLTGFDIYLDTDDAIVFEPFANGQKVHPLRYARDVLDFVVERTTPLAGSVEAWGESPGASAGKQSWSWLTKDFAPRKGSAGSGAPFLLLERSALRTAEAAQRAADAAMTRILRRRLRGCIAVLGNPGVRLGDAIRLEDMRADDLNASFQVRAVRHSLNKRQGFVTEIGFQAIGASA